MPTIRIADQGIIQEAVNEGPGIRLSLYVQGCSHHCKGCHNPETWNPSGGVERDIDELAEDILSRLTPIHQGVTFLGGEPFDQATELVLLGQIIKNRGYDIATYTGYLLGALQRSIDESTIALLDISDWLVDGRFILAKRDIGLKWRGSSNQRVWKNERGMWRVCQEVNHQS